MTVKSTESATAGEGLDWDNISAHLEYSKKRIQHHEIHASVTSTNDLALAQSGAGDGMPAVYLAEQQSAGRGRRGKQWFSPQAQNIYMSLVWAMSSAQRALGGFSIAMGVAIARCLQNYGLVAGLKWPNDVLVKGNKIAGILIETRIRADGVAVVVIGVGLNYAMQGLPQAGQRIEQPWTDFSSEYQGDRRVTRNELVASLLDQLLPACEQFTNEGLDGFLDAWQRMDVCLGCEVDVLVDGVCRTGKMLGIERDGAVKILHQDGEKRYHSAQISLRPRSGC